MTDRHYIALIHKDRSSAYGVSFPDVPGIVAVADTLDAAIAEAAAALDFAFEDWVGPLPVPQTLEALQADDTFRRDSENAVVAVIKPSAQYYQAAE